MIRKHLFYPALVLALFLTGPLAQASDGSVARMATILSHLHHYPSSSEKDELARISADTGQTEAVRSIARAMMNMRHHVSAGDRKRLDKIAQDTSQPREVRELAAVLAGINHKPGRRALSILHEISD